jgi:hypothetical protein
MKRLFFLSLIMVATALSATNNDWAQFYRYEGKNDSLTYQP